jgi:hypothetical protein
MTDAAVVVKPGHVKARANTEGPGHEKGQVDNQLTVDASTSVMVRDVKDPSSKVAFVCETRATDIAVVLCHSGDVNHGAVCGLLMERLQDVSVCFVCRVVLFVNDCAADLCFYARQVVSLTKWSISLSLRIVVRSFGGACLW